MLEELGYDHVTERPTGKRTTNAREMPPPGVRRFYNVNFKMPKNPV